MPQDTSQRFVAWRDRVRALNSDIIFLGYQMTIGTTTVPGPGHEVLRRVSGPASFMRDFNGAARTFGENKFNLYDPRSREWRERFLEACAVTLDSYSYRGLFLDQCSIFLSHGVVPSLRAELKAALAEMLVELRKRHPTSLIVANSAFDWPGVDGEMNERQKRNLEVELEPNPKHATPELNLGLVELDSDWGDSPELHKKLLRVLRAGELFSAARTYQRVPWFDIYDEVVDAARA